MLWLINKVWHSHNIRFGHSLVYINQHFTQHVCTFPFFPMLTISCVVSYSSSILFRLFFKGITQYLSMTIQKPYISTFYYLPRHVWKALHYIFIVVVFYTVNIDIRKRVCVTLGRYNSKAKHIVDNVRKTRLQ